MIRYLFMSHGKLLSTYYLFETPIQAACKAVGLVRPGGRGGTGRGTVSAHRFRHTVGTQLAEYGVKLHTITKVLGHTSVNMALSTRRSVTRKSCATTRPCSVPAPRSPARAADELRNGTLPDASVDWLRTKFFKTELELSRCLWLLAEGPCECHLYLTCAKFVTTPEYAPRLRARREVELPLARDAVERGWTARSNATAAPANASRGSWPTSASPSKLKERGSAPVRDQPVAELPERSSLVYVHSGLRQEHVDVDWAVSDVEGVHPVRPVLHARCTAETVVELPADPLAGDEVNSGGPARPRRYAEQRLHSGLDPQPTVGFAQLDVDLAQVFLAATGLEAISLMHADHVRKLVRHSRDSEADRSCVPTGGSLSSSGLLRPGRPYPLDGDFHSRCPCHSIEDLTLCGSEIGFDVTRLLKSTCSRVSRRSSCTGRLPATRTPNHSSARRWPARSAGN